MHGFELFGILYSCLVIGVILYVLSLLSRLVKSNERMAAAIEEVAIKLRRDDR